MSDPQLCTEGTMGPQTQEQHRYCTGLYERSPSASLEKHAFKQFALPAKISWLILQASLSVFDSIIRIFFLFNRQISWEGDSVCTPTQPKPQRSRQFRGCLESKRPAGCPSAGRGSARAATTAPAAVHWAAPAAPCLPLLPTFQQLVQAGDLPAAVYGVDCADALGQVHIV